MSSSSGVSFSGLASGLDTQAIIQALLAVEQRPLLQLEDRKDLIKQQKSLFGDIKTKLEELIEKAKDIRLSSQFVDFKANTDKEDYLTASAAPSAAAGSYEVEVTNLARSQVNSSLGRADRDVALNAAGTLFFDFAGGASENVSIDANDSLDSIASKINSADIGVRAQVVDTGAATDPFQLVITSTDPGDDNAFTMYGDPAPGNLDTLATEINGNVITTAQNATVLIDGIQIQRSTNTINDAIQGVTLDLVGENAPGETTRITVSPDTEATSAKVKEFVDTYNSIIDFVEGQSVVDDEGNTDSALFGDSTLRSIRSSLRSIVGSIVGTSNEAYSMLAQAGFKTETNGKITFTQSEFEAALLDDDDAVRELFTLENEGIAHKIIEGVELFTDSIDGLIKVRTDGLDTRNRGIDRSIDRLEKRLEQMEVSLTARFANLEVVMNQLQNQGASLGRF